MTVPPAAGDTEHVGAGGAAPRGGTTGALARCLSVPVADFAERYWSRAALFSPGVDPAADADAGFADLFGESAVDELVSRRGLRTPFARMAKNGSVLPAASYTRSGGTGATIADQLADDKVLAQLADGATLVLQALHRTWPPLVDFGSALSAELGHPVQINSYITPAGNQGFASHYDTHDVFVLQVTGVKRWIIHEPVLADPLPEQAWEQRRDQVRARAAEPALLELTLRPGDALYLPRGFLHSAAAQDELSIHLTVGVHPLTEHTLVREIVAVLAGNPALRRSLPMGLDLSDPSVLAPYLAAVAQELSAGVAAGGGTVHAAEIARRLGAELGRNTRPAPLAPLAQIAALAAVDDSTPVRLRPGLRCAVSAVAEGIELRALDRRIVLPAATQAALKTVLSGARFRAAELSGLDRDEQLVLLRRLLAEAVLVPAPD